MRRKSRTVFCGKIGIGGDNSVSVQSMLNIEPQKIAENIAEAKRLEEAGCDIIRIAVPNTDGVRLIGELKKNVSMPVVADIHFDYKLAIESVNAGCDKVRINPGNIGDDSRVKAVADCCRIHNVPIRIGVNSGSLEKDILAKYGAPTPEALCESAMFHAGLLNKFDFDDIVISLKSSDVKNMIAAYRLISGKVEYPLHLGVTETGTREKGIIKSAVGIGSLLCDGIGDTIRVSLTDDPIYEVDAAKKILGAVGMGCGINIVSCPTCGRTKNDLIGLVKRAETEIKSAGFDYKNITVAIMGCAVNGPGEAREADIGIACGEKKAMLFSHGEFLRSVDMEHALDELIEEIRRI